MANYNDLLKNITEDTDIEQYLNDFFDAKKYKDYEVSNNPDADQTKAIKIMFNSKKDIVERIRKALDYDSYCIEAFFSYLLISEDAYVQVSFDSYYENAKEYGSFNQYQKYCFIKIMELYVDFCLDINNITKAIKIQRLILILTNSSKPEYISKLAYMYFSIEDSDNFYKLYTDATFSVYEYLLLIITLLKHDEELRAKEVLLDMHKNIEYADYVDHVWDLDKNDIVQKNIIDAVEGCYDDISSIPTFFSWFNGVLDSAK